LIAGTLRDDLVFSRVAMLAPTSEVADQVVAQMKSAAILSI
jgi:hypothetical protein